MQFRFHMIIQLVPVEPEGGNMFGSSNDSGSSGNNLLDLSHLSTMNGLLFEI
jgi:hypothetical protein